MKKGICLSLLVLFNLHIFAQGSKVVISTFPERFNGNDKVKITLDLSQKTNFLASDELFIWAWNDNIALKVNNGEWNNSSESQMLKNEGNGVFSFTLVPNEFYGAKPDELTKIQFLIKTKSGNKQTEDLTLLIGKTVEETKAYFKSLRPKPEVFTPIDFRKSKVKPLKLNSKELQFEKMEQKVGDVVVKVDPRIELAYTIGVLAGYPFIIPDNMNYKQDILHHFSKFKDDPFVTEFTEKVFHSSIDAVSFVMLNIDENFEPMPTMSKSFVDKMGGIDSVQTFFNDMKKFCIKIKYGSFFNGQKQFYQLVVNNYAFANKDYNDIKLIEDYYGIKQKSYSIVLNLLFANGYFGVIAKDYNGNSSVNALIQPSSVSNSIPLFPTSIGEYALLFHEFSHSFVNPLVDSYANEVNTYEHLYEPIEESMKSQGYFEWHVTVKEQIVRAVTCRLGALKYGKEIGKNYFEDIEKAHRFIYVEALIEKLKIYENNRDKYKDFSSFFPELLNVFKDFKPSEILKLQKEVEDIRNANVIKKISKIGEFGYDKDCIVIVSTHEKTKEDQLVVNHSANEFNNMMPKKYKLITDEEALGQDLGQYNILVFGTIEGNSFAKKYIQNLPISISDKGVMTTRMNNGDDFQIMASWVSPFNPNNTMLFFTAQKAINIKDYAYSPYKEGYHYWIAKNLVTIDAGDYKNWGGKWMP